MIIREARLHDALILVAAQKETALTPGLLVSRPRELGQRGFRAKIAELTKTGRYIVAQKDGEIAGDAFLNPMPLEALSHVFRLTIVVHPGFRNEGVGEALMRDLMGWGETNVSFRKNRTARQGNQ